MIPHKILQIIPAPPGSWLTVVNYDRDNFWHDTQPASCLALVEVEERSGRKERFVMPLGFRDSLTFLTTGPENVQLHPSKNEAKEYIGSIELERLKIVKA